ncbi:MAG: hypothetical protein LBF22_14265 [Deltaproteobacteria bacterium]|nr:hypothetical protein [Deltaproteobacteria bacterium]
MNSSSSKVLVTIIGADRPGIVHLVSKVFFEHGCVMSELTQTTLLGQFAGLFSVLTPEDVVTEELSSALTHSLNGTGLSAWITYIKNDTPPLDQNLEPYVITITGPDSPKLIPALSGTIASFKVNIDNLRSVQLSQTDRNASERPPMVLVLEVSVPQAVSQTVFRQALALIAEELGIEVNLQHRNIFEAIHRV